MVQNLLHNLAIAISAITTTNHEVVPASLPLHTCTWSCRAAIDRLRQQNARLKEDLLLENKFSVRPSNAGATQLINKLQDEADLYTRKVSTQLF
jgi:hypothetical protein